MTAFYSPVFHGLTRFCVISAMILALFASSSALAAPATQPAATRPAAVAAPPAPVPVPPKLPAPPAPPGTKLVQVPRPPTPPPPTTRPTTITPITEEPVVIRVFKLKYVDPKSVISAIMTTLGDQAAKVTAGPGNSIVIAAKRASLAAIEQLLERLDAAPDEPRETSTMTVSLKKARALELAPVIQKAVSSLRECIPWPAGNLLVVAGSPASVETARTLIATLDAASVEPPPQPLPAPPGVRMPPQPPKDFTTRVYALKHARPSGPIIDALRVVAGPGSSISGDERTRSVIVTAQPPGLDVVQNVLAQLDRPATQPETAPIRLRIRFLWLVSGLAEDKFSAPPADLLPLVEELQRIGVSHLRLAAQSIVEGMPGQKFQITASPMLANRCDLQLEGSIEEQNGAQPYISFRVRATEQAPYMVPDKSGYKVVETRDLCSIQTTLVTPLGKAIVAGVTPMDKMTAVFVVQVLPQ